MVHAIGAPKAMERFTMARRLAVRRPGGRNHMRGPVDIAILKRCVLVFTGLRRWQTRQRRQTFRPSRVVRRLSLRAWTSPLRTSARWSLPPAAMMTVRSCQNCSTRYPTAKITPTAPDTRAAATPPSSRDRPLRSYRSARTVGPGKRTVQPHAPETRPRAPPDTMARGSGNGGQATTRATGPRRRCAGSRPSEAAQAPEIRTAKPPKSRPHRTDQSLLGPRHRRNHSSALNPTGKGLGSGWVCLPASTLLFTLTAVILFSLRDAFRLFRYDAPSLAKSSALHRRYAGHRHRQSATALRERSLPLCPA